ncbi:hypothetical protein C2845_PM05G36380 [Panicum miliaceum]|uniref:Uncharacterized protein n=1 Tax=Panicum miliaceum TaxID=4540 RepID=A0A3L6SUZ8_PANMI|nr:hypothetical protein C2845_PM05G36380 [Panicum miliaceum]
MRRRSSSRSRLLRAWRSSAGHHDPRTEEHLQAPGKCASICWICSGLYQSLNRIKKILDGEEAHWPRS